MHRLLLVSLLTSSVPSFSEGLSPKSILLSDAGRTRVAENLSRVDGNLSTVLRNIAKAERNLLTVQSELMDITTLKIEYRLLKRDLSTFLANANKKFKKETKVLGRLQEIKARLESNPDDRTAEEIKKIDVLNRQLWQLNLNDKAGVTQIKNANKMLWRVSKSILQIDARKGPLEDSVKYWQSEGERFKKIKDVFVSWKQEYEKVLDLDETLNRAVASQ